MAIKFPLKSGSSSRRPSTCACNSSRIWSISPEIPGSWKRWKSSPQQENADFMGLNGLMWVKDNIKQQKPWVNKLFIYIYMYIQIYSYNGIYTLSGFTYGVFIIIGGWDCPRIAIFCGCIGTPIVWPWPEGAYWVDQFARWQTTRQVGLSEGDPPKWPTLW